MKTPIQKMLDQVEWKEIINPSEPELTPINDDLPYATHMGVLDIGEFQFKVYQLNDGQRVIDEEDIKKFFGGEEENSS